MSSVRYVLTRCQKHVQFTFQIYMHLQLVATLMQVFLDRLYADEQLYYYYSGCLSEKVLV